MTKSIETVRTAFEAEGISIREWARQNGFKPRTVYAVLYGQVKCTRGEGHRIAVALGLKAAPAHPFLSRHAA